MVIWLETVFCEADFTMKVPVGYTEILHNQESHRPQLWSLPTLTLKNTPPSRKHCAPMKGHFE